MCTVQTAEACALANVRPAVRNVPAPAAETIVSAEITAAADKRKEQIKPLGA